MHTSEGLRSTRFSPLVTGAWALVFLALVAVVVWIGRSGDRLDSISSPERALALVVGRTLDLRDAIEALPAWERRLHELTSPGGAVELDQAIEWHEELARTSLDPLVELRLAVLEAEAGRQAVVRRRLAAWALWGEPYASLARLVRAAYVDPPPERALARGILVDADAMDAAGLEAGWFRSRLAWRLAERTGDAALLAAARDEATTRRTALLWRARGGSALDLATTVLGGVALLAALGRLRGAPGALRIGAASLPPRWDAGATLAVLVRGAGVGGLLLVAVGLIHGQTPLTEEGLKVAANLAAVPLLFLAHRHLLRPAGVGFGAGLGLRWLPGRAPRRRLVGVTLALLAAGSLGDWAIGLGSERLGHAAHWTEWFDEALAWGNAWVAGVSLLDSVVLAPALEEIVFRGFLYGALRVRLGAGPSAVASATVFAVAHGYGVAGFASVIWSGLLWAWSYERTRSLLPGILAHALNNVSVALGVVALAR